MGTHFFTKSGRTMSGEFPEIKSKHSLVAKHVTKERWDKVKDIETKTCGFTIAKACACAIEFDNQHCGIYAGDWDCYKDFSEIFDAIIQDYHGISPDAKHTSDMDPSKITGNIEAGVPVHSTRIRVGRSIDGFGLSPGITKQQRIDVEKLMSSALSKLTGDLAGKYYLLPVWKKLSVNNSLMIISSLSVETATLLLLVWNVIGLRAVVSSTTMPRPSFCGSMRKIR